MAVLEQRYAEALLSAAKDPAEANLIGSALKDLCQSMQEDPDTREFFMAPAVPIHIKRDTVAKIYPQTKQRLVVNFISLLLDKGRMEILPAIHREYERLKNIMQERLDIKISSALPLEDSQVELIVEKYRKQYGALSASVTRVTDPSLLGGILIQIGDIRIDDTQKKRLKALQQSIGNGQTI